jgi:hypothetical protein
MQLTLSTSQTVVDVGFRPVAFYFEGYQDSSTDMYFMWDSEKRGNYELMLARSSGGGLNIYQGSVGSPISSPYYGIQSVTDTGLILYNWYKTFTVNAVIVKSFND